MRLGRAVLGLPASLLLLLLGRAHAESVGGQQLPQDQRLPVAVRKMSLDEGEKFYPDQYFTFDDGHEHGNDAEASPDSTDVGHRLGIFYYGPRPPPIIASPAEGDEGRWPRAVRSLPGDAKSEETAAGGLGTRGAAGGLGAGGAAAKESNASVSAVDGPLSILGRPPFAVHHEVDMSAQRRPQQQQQQQPHSSEASPWQVFRRAADALARLQRRQWGCPTGTNSCEAIGYPYSCCQTDETCYEVTDTGLGPVGCCPQGQTCSGSASTCAADQSACPVSLGGGCCISGYICQGVGCVASSTTSAAASPTTFTTTSTAIVVTPLPSTVVVTVVVTHTPGRTATTSTTTLTSTPSAATTTKVVTETTTAASGGVAPVKPTFGASATTTKITTTAATTSKTTSSAGTTSAGSCPTGYYPCLAFVGGGCCQTGRDCRPTSCPPTSSTTVVSGAGATIVVPAGDDASRAAATAAGATCATGWFLCPSSAGPTAGCCPSGYGCGTASCTLASASSTGRVQKEQPSAASSAAGSGRLPLSWPWLCLWPAMLAVSMI